MIIKLQHPQYTATDGSPIGQLNRERYYIELQADGNHETVYTSEIYESREAAEHAIAFITEGRTTGSFTINDTTTA